MNSPPLTSTCAPWTKLATSEARTTTIAATSSGVPIRPRGVAANRPLARLGRPVGDHRRIDDPRVDAVRGDAVRARETCDRLRERRHARLRGRVGGAGREPAHLPRERRDGDDAAAPPRDHRLERRLAREERSAEVRRLDPVPLLGSNPVERRRVEDAGAGDENVEPAPSASGLANETTAVLRHRHVADRCGGLPADLGRSRLDVRPRRGRRG